MLVVVELIELLKRKRAAAVCVGRWRRVDGWMGDDTCEGRLTQGKRGSRAKREETCTKNTESWRRKKKKTNSRSAHSAAIYTCFFRPFAGSELLFALFFFCFSCFFCFFSWSAPPVASLPSSTPPTFLLSLSFCQKRDHWIPLAATDRNAPTKGSAHTVVARQQDLF